MYQEPTNINEWDLTAMDQPFAIEDEFTEGIIARVKETLAMKSKDVQTANYYRAIYKEKVLDALRRVNEGDDKSGLTPDLHFI